MSVYTLEQIEQLPAEVIDAIYDSEVNDRHVKEVFPLLTEEQGAKLSELMLDVYFRAVTPSAFLSLCREIVADEEKYKLVSNKVLGYSFLPVADYLQTDIVKLISANGGDPNLFRQRTPVGEVVAQVRRKSGIGFKDQALTHRFDNIIRSKIQDVRKDPQVLELLLKPAKTGGIGLDELTAKRVLELAILEVAALQKQGVDVVPDEMYEQEQAAAKTAATPTEPKSAPSAPAAAEAALPSPAELAQAVSPEELKPLVEAIVSEPLPAKEKKPESFQTVTLEDEREIATLHKKKTEKLDSAQHRSVQETLEDMVNAAVVVCGEACASEELRGRFRTIVSLYFRDLRDALETKSKLTTPTASGGMGFAEAEAERVMALLKDRATDFRETMRQAAAEEKQRFVVEQAAKEAAAVQARQQAEQTALDQKYADLAAKKKGSFFGRLMGKKSVAAAPATSPPPIAIPPPDSNQPLPTYQPTNLPTPKIIKVQPAEKLELPPAVASALFPEETAAPEPNPDFIQDLANEVSAAKQEPEAAVQAPQPPAAGVPAKAGTQQQPPAPPPLPMERPIVADVKYVPKVMGPADYLQSLTLKEFRQLSKSPREATLKVKDKIDLLEEKSFETKTQGITAWQGSEVNKLYLEILRASLEGKPVPDIIADREAKQLPTLTKEEFAAIMELNRKLRFG